MSAVDHPAATEVLRPPPPPRGWPRERVIGYILVFLWALALVGLVAYLVSAWKPDMFWRYAPGYLSGVWVTIKLVAISVVIGALLSVPIAYGRMSRNPIIASFAYAYVYFFRGTPLLAQAFLVYYGFGSFRPQLDAIGLWSFFRDAFNCALFAFSLNTAAYQAEILRGAIQSVPKGQWEGAESLGLPRLLTLRKIIFPQALRVIVPPLTSQYLNLIKNSTLAVAIGFPDLFAISGTVINQTGRAVEMIAIIMSLYLAISLLTAAAMNWYNQRVRLVER